MKKYALAYKFLSVIVLFLFLVSGCTVRKYTVIRERPDLVQEGNKGYLLGTAPERTDEMKTTRTTYVVEVEFGQGVEVDQPMAVTSEAESNVVEPVEEDMAEVEYVVEDSAIEEPVVIEVEPNLK